MNRHFEDTVYYLKRAGETAREGISEEVGPVERRMRELTGREKEPEPSRVETIRAELEALGERAEGEARAALADARESLAEYRPLRN